MPAPCPDPRPAPAGAALTRPSPALCGALRDAAGSVTHLPPPCTAQALGRVPGRFPWFRMPRPSAPSLSLVGLLLSAALASAAHAADPAPPGVTVYRCSDSRGQLVALRDSPCLAGERQQVLQMQRPQDPPPRAVTTAPVPPAPAAAPVREVRIVTVQPARAMYECVSPEGQRYTSDNDEGNPRWVPFWTLGYAHRPGWRPGGPPPGGALPGGPMPGGPGGPGGPMPPAHHPGPGYVAVPAGTWVRDRCERLTQGEVCGRLSDRRYEILRAYHASMPSQRQALDREQAQIDARMAGECGGR